MTTPSLAERIRSRAGAADIRPAGEVVDRLGVYLELLAFWNRRINLTAFDLSTISDDAIDRLVIEPLAAVPLVRPTDRYAVDIGTGGGSPAVPLMIAVPAISMALVEVRVRKGAFLREVVRTLELPATVEICRADEVALRQPAAFDLVTFRAVRADRELWRVVALLLAGGGRVLWFGGFGHKTESNFVVSGTAGQTVALERRL